MSEPLRTELFHTEAERDGDDLVLRIRGAFSWRALEGWQGIHAMTIDFDLFPPNRRIRHQYSRIGMSSHRVEQK